MERAISIFKEQEILERRLLLESLSTRDLIDAISWRGPSVIAAEKAHNDDFDKTVIQPIAQDEIRSQRIATESDLNIPFYAIFAPGMEVQLHRAIHASLPVLPPARFDALNSSVRSISTRLSRVLLLLLRKFRIQYPSNTYSDFVDYFLQSRELLMEKFPLFGRFAAHMMKGYARSFGEMAERFSNDRDELASRGLIAEGDTIQHIEAELSDPHCGLQSVLILTLISGKKIVYKPKSLFFEEIGATLIAEALARGDESPVHIPGTISRPEYGWMEMAGTDTEIDGKDLPKLFQKFGCAIALAHVANTTDLHSENIIVSGGTPTIFDLETVLTPGILTHEANSPWPESKLLNSIMLSVARTLLVPDFMHTPDLGIEMDMSALTGVSEQQSPLSFLKWSACGTLAMECEPIRPVVKSGSVIPQSKGKEINPAHYAQTILDGFDLQYATLISNRRSIEQIANSLPKESRVRLVLRNTRVFAWLLNRLTEPQNLQDGSMYSIECEHLIGTSSIDTTEKRNRFEIYLHERKALEALDIPKVEVNVWTNETFVNGIAGGIFTGDTPMQSFKKKMEILSSEDCEVQTRIIRAAFSMEAEVNEISKDTIHTEALVEQPLKPFQSDHFVLNTLSALKKSCARSHEINEWITAEPMGIHRARLVVADQSVYSGVLGFCQFASIGMRYSESSEMEGILCECLGHWKDRLAWGLEQKVTSSQRFVPSLGHCGHALSALADISKHSEGIVHPGMIKVGLDALILALERQPRALDVLSGLGGALLGVLSIHGYSGALDTARTLAEILLQKRESSASGRRGWRDTNGRFMNGFSHGQAGIAFALLQLYWRLPDPALLEAAEEAMLLENETFDHTAMNWQDHRLGTPNATVWTWCHGGPGIALSRCLHRRITGKSTFDKDIEAFTNRFTLWAPEFTTLCCGASGVIDCARFVDQLIDSPSLRKVIAQKEKALYHGISASGGVRCFNNIPAREFTPGLFQGWTGVAYLVASRELGEPFSGLTTFGHTLPNTTATENLSEQSRLALQRTGVCPKVMQPLHIT